MTKIDAHQHFWSYSAEEYPWISGDAMSPIRRSFTPDDLASEQSQFGFDGSIAVQARQSMTESRWLLQLAQNHPRIRGVVGWVDLCGQTLEDELSELSPHSAFVGVRHVVQDEPDDRFLLRPDFVAGIGRLKAHQLTYDLLVFPKQLPAAIELVRQFPEQPFVLDHIAKPFIKDGVIRPWYRQIGELAACPNVCCKVSGMVTEAVWRGWNKRDFGPYLDVVFDAFGVDRIMFGSDWPVCLLSADYGEVVELVQEYIEELDEDTQGKILGQNALRFYGVQ